MKRGSGFKQPPKRQRGSGQSFGLNPIAIPSIRDQSQGMHRIEGISVSVQDLGFSPLTSATIGSGLMGPPRA